MLLIHNKVAKRPELNYLQTIEIFKKYRPIYIVVAEEFRK